jgi:hypothetical protein
MLASHYHRMLETCYDLSPYFSAPILYSVRVSVLQPFFSCRVFDVGHRSYGWVLDLDLQIVHDVILPTILNPRTHFEILIRMQRLLVLALSRIQADSPVSPELLSKLLTFLTSSQPALRNAARKTWDAVAQYQLTSIGARYACLLLFIFLCLSVVLRLR